MHQSSSVDSQITFQTQYLAHQLDNIKKREVKNLADERFLEAICMGIAHIEIRKPLVERDVRHCNWRYLPWEIIENAKKQSALEPDQRMKLADKLSLLDSRKMVAVSSGESSWDVLIWAHTEVDSSYSRAGRAATLDGSMRIRGGQTRVTADRVSSSLTDLKPYEQSNKVRGLMITFFKDKLLTPALTPIKIQLTPYPPIRGKDSSKMRLEKSEAYSRIILTARMHAEATIPRIYRGDCRYHAWGNLVNVKIARTRREETLEADGNMCLQVMLHRSSLKHGLDEASAAGRITFLHLFDVLLGVLSRRHKQQVVMRSINLRDIKMHKEYNTSGELTYGFWIRRTKFSWFPEADLVKPSGEPLCPKAKKMSPKTIWDSIETIAPENLLNLKINGVIKDYKPSQAEDMWAAGVILALFLFERKNLTFLNDLEALKKTALEYQAFKKSVDTQQEGDRELIEKRLKKTFHESKKAFHKSLYHFIETNEKVSTVDPYIFLILSLMNPDPSQRITADGCLEKEKLLKQVYQLNSHKVDLESSDSLTS